MGWPSIFNLSELTKEIPKFPNENAAFVPFSQISPVFIWLVFVVASLWTVSLTELLLWYSSCASLIHLFALSILNHQPMVLASLQFWREQLVADVTHERQSTDLHYNYSWTRLAYSVFFSPTILYNCRCHWHFTVSAQLVNSVYRVFF